MFILRKSLKKHSRGIQLLAERQYVAISDYVWTANGDEATKSVEATISIDTERETFYLSIPDNRLDSVIERLTALRDKRAI